MRRPWELAHMQASPAPAAGGPRVYVPFTLPDTSASAFAILELVGFSSSPSSSPTSLSPSLPTSIMAQPTPTQLNCHSQLQCPISFSLPISQTFDVPNPAKIPTESSITSLTESSTTCPHDASASCPPNPHGTKSAHGAVDVAAFSSSPAFPTKPAVVPIHIKEHVVHATSQNFKDIVQQLTGASSIDKPSISRQLKLASGATMSTLPAKKPLDALSVKVDASKGFKTTPFKLQQRRKYQRNLEKLSTESGKLALPISPLSPSPVTPLASYFKKACIAVTPTGSQSSGHSSEISSPEASVPESNSSNASYPANVDAPCSSGKGGVAHAVSRFQEDGPMAETLPGPAILSLFPECPP